MFDAFGDPVDAQGRLRTLPQGLGVVAWEDETVEVPEVKSRGRVFGHRDVAKVAVEAEKEG